MQWQMECAGATHALLADFHRRAFGEGEINNPMPDPPRYWIHDLLAMNLLDQEAQARFMERLTRR